MQAHYYSPWKKLDALLYAGALDGEKYSEPIHTYDKPIAPFTKVRKWRAAVLRAHEKISDNLPAEYELVINSDTKSSLRLRFNYRAGKLEKSYKFEFENGILKELGSGDSERI
jgi:hypothetical protein